MRGKFKVNKQTLLRRVANAINKARQKHMNQETGKRESKIREKNMKIRLGNVVSVCFEVLQ